MFDFGFGEMMIIGAVGLVVLGPERLPTVARTAGEWIGKAQRLVSQVKDDISRETELSELKRIQEEAQKLASDFKSTVEKSASEIESASSSITNDLKQTSEDVQKSFDALSTPDKEALEKAAETVSNDFGVIEQDTSSGYTEAKDVASTTKVQTNNDIADFYGWNDVPENAPAPTYEWKEPKTFSKRYHSGPSVDELAQEIERLRRELGMRDAAAMQGRNRRLAARARTNRPRIYR